MRVAIATDIHGNRHAFEAVIDAAERDGAEELWCLGDLVGYGGDPDASVELARRHCSVCLAGNHDLAVVDVLSLEEFSRGAALAATVDARRDRARDARVPALAQARGQRAGRRASSTPPRATRSGSTCCPG